MPHIDGWLLQRQGVRLLRGSAAGLITRHSGFRPPVIAFTFPTVAPAYASPPPRQAKLLQRADSFNDPQSGNGILRVNGHWRTIEDGGREQLVEAGKIALLGRHGCGVFASSK